MRDTVTVMLVAGALLGACNVSNVPGFCGVTDDARVAVAEVDPSQYPAEVAKHVDEVRASADELSGEQGALAALAADAFEEASRTAPNSLEFSDAYNRFVDYSNEFNHRYCDEQVGPE